MAGRASDVGRDSAPPSKKQRKEVTLRVAMLDGTTFGVTVPERGCVREVKRKIAEVRVQLLSHADVLATFTVINDCSRKASPLG